VPAKLSGPPRAPTPPPFLVAIPSYDRADSIGEKTLSLLERQGLPPGRVFIFVANESERMRYASRLGAKWPNIVVGVPTLWRQRNFITNYFEEGAHVISMDDDVEDLYRLAPLPGAEPKRGEGVLEVLPPGALAELAADAWRKMHRGGVFLWSLNVSANTLFMHASQATLKLGLCNGFFWGCRNRRHEDLLLRYGDGHEDAERTLRYFARDGAVLRYQSICARTRCHGNSGGLQASMTAEERRDTERRGLESLCHEFPLYVVPKEETALGFKFRTSQCKVLEAEAVISVMQFRDANARNQLAMLEGGCWVGIRGHGAVSRGRLRRATPKGMLLSCSEGEEVEQIDPEEEDRREGTCSFLEVGVAEFYEAMRESQIFIVWLPQVSCEALQVEYREPSCQLKRLFSGSCGGAGVGVESLPARKPSSMRKRKQNSVMHENAPSRASACGDAGIAASEGEASLPGVVSNGGPSEATAAKPDACRALAGGGVGASSPMKRQRL